MEVEMERAELGGRLVVSLEPVPDFDALPPSVVGLVLGFGAISPSGAGQVSFPSGVQLLPRTSLASHVLSPSGEEQTLGGGRVGVGQERTVQDERFRA
jgi:hypothetical protein